MKYISRIILIISIILRLQVYASPDVKQAPEVFKKWLEWQHAYDPVNLAEQAQSLSLSFNQTAKQCLEDRLTQLRINFTPFLQRLSENQINEHGHLFYQETPRELQESLQKIYTAAEYDMMLFTAQLDALGLNECRAFEKEKLSQETIYTNAILCGAIFGQANPLKDNALLFSVANKFATFCFNQDTFQDFLKMLLDSYYYPTVRLLFSTISHHFSGIGWHNWSTACLTQLKQAGSEGKRVVYLAGGSDIYQLIRNGIYNITIIDPQLPSQPKYYANEWAWLIKGNSPNGGIGDQLIFEEQGIIMTRISYQENKRTFKARLADGQVVNIMPSTTTWVISNAQGKQLGTYILERRFIEQYDFAASDNQVLLMSFNELVFVSLPDHLHGWHIEPSKFPHSLQLFVKQLHKPIGKTEVCNMRTTSLFNASDFKFISLGSCIN